MNDTMNLTPTARPLQRRQQLHRRLVQDAQDALQRVGGTR